MKQQLIPKHRRRKRQPSADQLREQLALAADEIIRLREQFQPYEFVDSIIGDAHRTSRRNPPPPPAPPPPRDVTGRNYQRPWWRRIFRSAT